MKNGGKNKSVAFIILVSIYIYIYIYIIIDPFKDVNNKKNITTPLCISGPEALLISISHNCQNKLSSAFFLSLTTNK